MNCILCVSRGNYSSSHTGITLLACFVVYIGGFSLPTGAQGVLASPFAPLHGLGSPLAAPYAGSPVGGNLFTKMSWLTCTSYA